jgi:signal transduction histidine kinase
MDTQEGSTAGTHTTVEAIDRERERLAVELHEGLGQTLVGVHLLASMCARLAQERADADDPLRSQLAQLATLSEEATERLRGLSRSSAPAFGRLEEALQSLSDDIRMRYQLRTSCALPAQPLPVLAPPQVRQLYLAAADTVHHLLERASLQAVDLYAEVEDGQLELVLSAACREPPATEGAKDAEALRLAACRMHLLGGSLRVNASARRLRASLRVPI